jgi:hypothetical protein
LVGALAGKGRVLVVGAGSVVAVVVLVVSIMMVVVAVLVMVADCNGCKFGGGITRSHEAAGTCSVNLQDGHRHEPFGSVGGFVLASQDKYSEKNLSPVS